LKNRNFFRIVFALILREITTTYGRNPGGFLWAFLEPVAAIILLSVVFSYALRSPALGDNFPLFYATGYLPYLIYSDTANKIAKAIKYSRQLLRYPIISYLDAIVARLLIATLINCTVFVIITTTIILVFDITLIIEMEKIAGAIFLALLMALSIGSLNCFLMTKYPTWERFWKIINRPTILLSGIFFLLESLPEPIRGFLAWNPIIHIVAMMRSGFYSTYDADFVSPVYVFLVALVLLALGLGSLAMQYRKILNEL
jgi:capsular polysaccharide transport system permease protein